jgi:4-hydroxy-tetrahydrodipicolinate synthase
MIYLRRRDEGLNKLIDGVYAVSVTPFNEDGSFNISSAKKHLDNLIQNGIQGICVLGATGEYQSVSNEEHKEYVKEILTYLRGRVSVVVGVTRERPEDVVDLMQNALDFGADAGMILPPFYCNPSQDEIYAHFEYITNNCELPMVVYNNPGSAGVDILESTMLKILKLPTAKAMKESTGSIQRLTKAVMKNKSDIKVFCGGDNLALESFLMGANGWISMAANFAPNDCVNLFNASQNGDLKQALTIYKRLLPALSLLEEVEKPAATIKYIITKYKGINAGYMRRPRLELSKQEINYINSVIDFNSIS